MHEQNKDLQYEELEREVAQAVRQVRAGRAGRRRRSAGS